MYNEELFKKTDEIISKVKNGEQLYRECAEFNVCVQQLVRGEDPLELIGQLCQRMEDYKKALNYRIVHEPCPPRFITPTGAVEEILRKSSNH